MPKPTHRVIKEYTQEQFDQVKRQAFGWGFATCAGLITVILLYVLVAGRLH